MKSHSSDQIELIFKEIITKSIFSWIMDWVQKVGAGENSRKISLYGHSGAILKTFQIYVEFLTLGEQKGCM